jgi:magnesium transporter
MALDTALALGLIQSHPDEAARVVEDLPTEAAAGVLREVPREAARELLSRIAAHALDALLPCLESERLAEMLDGIGTDTAARIMRRLPGSRQEEVLTGLPRRRAASLRVLLRHPEDTAGALLDPDVLALSAELSAAEALDQVRAHPERARYNLYVTDAEQRLVGALNLRELLLAPPDARLLSVMLPATHRLPAHADRHRIVAHPGWRDVHALPVVDASGAYLGAIRYHTLRRIERELARADSSAGATARALGELYATGASSLLQALTGPRRAGVGP